jgi:biotin operon repressor
MAASKDPDLRRSQRLIVTPKGEVFDGSAWARTLIQDISASGLLLVCSKTFAPGQKLALKLHISSATIVECTVEVRHSNDMGTGVQIRSMSDQHRRTYDRYLQEYFSQHLGRLG